MARSRRYQPNPDQLPLIEPATSWTVPTELPDWRGRPLALDLETRDDGLSADLGSGWAYPGRGWVAGISAAVSGTESLYAPLRHPDTANLDIGRVADWLRDHIRAAPRVIFHNAGYDLGWLGTDIGATVPDELIEDTQAMAVGVDENRQRGTYNLDACCRWRGVPGKDERALREAAAVYGLDAKKDLWRLPARHVGPYAEADARATWGLRESLAPVLVEEGTWDAFRTEMDLVNMVVAIRRRGIRLDTDHCHRVRAELLRRRDEALAELTDRLPPLTGRAVAIGDVDSPQWQERVHAEVFGREWVDRLPRTEKGGRPSFSKTWMRGHEHWLPRLVSQASAYHDAGEKFVGQYLLGYEHRGRIHAEIHQYRSDEGGTRSFRFSYSDPPLQQMPARDEELATAIRGALLPEEGEIWGAADYCHDNRTEVLTRRGWVLFASLREDDEVAQWNSGRVEFVVPKSIYRGRPKLRRMLLVRGQRQLNFCTTAQHGFLLRDYDGGTERVLADKVPSLLPRRIVPQTGILIGGDDSEDEDVVRLAAALQADAADRGDWVFYLKKPRKIDRLLSLVRKLGLRYRYKERAKGDQTLICVRDDQRCRRYLGEGKVFDLERLLSLSERLRRIFVSELLLWDGRSYSETRGSYGSVVERNVEVAQILCTTLGKRAAMRMHLAAGRRPFYHITISDREGTWGTDKMTAEWVNYRGSVYCAEVPSGYLVTRREGHTLVSSNSQQEYRLIVHFAQACGMAGAQRAVDAYQEDPDTDFHMLVVALTGLERKPAKDTNFAKAFGAGVPKFASMIGKTVEEARAIYQQYDREMPFVSRLAEFCQARADSRGYLRLLDGARSHFDEWEPRHRDWRKESDARAAGLTTTPCSLAEAQERCDDPRHPWERPLRRAYTHKAMNRLIQGSAARQTKMAMRACWREGLLPLIQMHDELGFSLSDEGQGRRAAEIMRDVVRLEVPVKVDSEYGVNWGRAAKTRDKSYGATWSEAVAERDRP